VGTDNRREGTAVARAACYPGSEVFGVQGQSDPVGPGPHLLERAVEARPWPHVQSTTRGSLTPPHSGKCAIHYQGKGSVNTMGQPIDPTTHIGGYVPSTYRQAGRPSPTSHTRGSV